MILRMTRLGLLATSLVLPCGSAFGQQLVPPPELPPVVGPGWTVTPSLGAASSWDDNVALTSAQQGELEDQVTTVLSSLTSQYRGQRGEFLIEYRGAYDFYRRYSSFDAPDHRGRVEAERRLGRRVSAFARNSFSLTPTTEVPFADTGLLTLRRRNTSSNDFRGGLDLTLWRRTLMTVAYGSQWIELAGDEEVQPLLRGGYAHRGDLTLRRQVSQRVALGGTYDFQHAVVSDGEATFDIQRTAALLEVALARPLILSGSAGYAWQLAGQQAAESAPTMSADLRYQAERTAWTIGYERTYLASFGFGGTVQNEELRATIDVPITRRFELAGRLSARESDPIQAGGVNLRSLSAQASANWTLVSWLRLELFVVGTRQDTQLAGGQINRTRAGVRLLTIHPMRLR